MKINATTEEVRERISQKKEEKKETWADKSGSKKATEKGGLTVIVPAF